MRMLILVNELVFLFDIRIHLFSFAPTGGKADPNMKKHQEASVETLRDAKQS